MGIAISGASRPVQAQGESELIVVGRSLLQAELIFDRFLGAGALLGLSDCSGLPLLLKSLEAEDPVIVRAAADTLLSSGANTLFPALNKRAIEKVSIGTPVLWSLTENFHPEFTPLILATLKKGEGAPLRAAILAIARSGDNAFLPPLQELLERTDLEGLSQAYALHAIASLGAGLRVRDRVMADSKARQAAEREMAAMSLGYLNDAASRTALDALIKDPAPQVRIAALASAARRGDVRAADQLEAIIRSGDIHTAMLASASLRRLLAAQATAIIERSATCCDLAPEITQRLLESWANVRGERAPGAAIGSRGLHHANPDVRLQAIWALGRRAEPGTELLASPFLNDTDLALRGMALWALVQIGQKLPENNATKRHPVSHPVCNMDATNTSTQKRADHAG